MFLVCGEALFDFFLTHEDGPRAATYAARAGGSPFNVAIGLARLDQPCGLLAGISTDMLGQRLVQVLHDEGVSEDWLVRSNRPTTVSLVGLDTAGVPAYRFLDASSAGTGMISDDMPEIDEDILGLHFGSYSLVAEPVAEAFARLAEIHDDKFITVDPNIRPTVEPDMAIWRRRLDALYNIADLVKISSEDLELIEPETTPEAFAQRLLGQGVKLVVVTDGGETATGWARNGAVARAFPPKVDVVDTVGAGDTFMAALIAQLVSSPQGPAPTIDHIDVADLQRILDYCARAASITCTRQGADLPRASELEGGI